jgi:hypothetical protein
MYSCKTRLDYVAQVQYDKLISVQIKSKTRSASRALYCSLSNVKCPLAIMIQSVYVPQSALRNLKGMEYSEPDYRGVMFGMCSYKSVQLIMHY